MPEKLRLPSEENPKGKKPEEQPIEDTQSPEYFAAHAEEIARENAEFEKSKNEWNKISPEDFDFLTEAGFDMANVRETETNEGEMLEIPKREGLSAFVKKENMRAWIEKMKDDKELAGLLKGVEVAYDEGAEKLPQDAEPM